MTKDNQFLKLTVQNDLKSLTEISEFIRSNMTGMGICHDKIAEVQIAVDEAFTNIIQHSRPIYNNRNAGSIEITCLKSRENFQIKIKNYGEPFDPISAEINPDLTTDLIERKVGGLGIHFIKNLLDDLKYEYFEPGGYEVLTMVKVV
ncbi:ATP-binding protein [candidate division KSB1 bacterium]|nr:ATP-binding protein [candidate division KSB1 bacterium]